MGGKTRNIAIADCDFCVYFSQIIKLVAKNEDYINSYNNPLKRRNTDYRGFYKIRTIGFATKGD